MPYTMKPTRPRHDTKCPDGFTCYGWRQVHKGGYVRFAHNKHFHDDLAQWAGMWVYVTLADMWGCDVDVWPDGAFAGTPLQCRRYEAGFLTKSVN